MKSYADSPGVTSLGQISSLSLLDARRTWVWLESPARLFTTSGVIVKGANWLSGLKAFFGCLILAGLTLISQWIAYRDRSSTNHARTLAPNARFRSYMTFLPSIGASLLIVANIELTSNAVRMRLLAGDGVGIIAALSTGRVFYCATIYIGHGLNIMVRSIAESPSVKMPCSVGYRPTLAISSRNVPQ